MKLPTNVQSCTAYLFFVKCLCRKWRHVTLYWFIQVKFPILPEFSNYSHSHAFADTGNSHHSVRVARQPVLYICHANTCQQNKATNTTVSFMLHHVSADYSVLKTIQSALKLCDMNLCSSHYRICSHIHTHIHTKNQTVFTDCCNMTLK